MPLINMDYDGLKASIIEMLSGAEVKVNTATFKNDTVNIKSKDDVLTYMIHLGYLGYNQKTKTAFVPNEEIRQELANAIESRKWDEMAAFQRDSDKLLNATLDMDGASVAMQIEKIHNEYASVIQYHNENSLSRSYRLRILVRCSTISNRFASSQQAEDLQTLSLSRSLNTVYPTRLWSLN